MKRKRLGRVLLHDPSYEVLWIDLQDLNEPFPARYEGPILSPGQEVVVEGNPRSKREYNIKLAHDIGAPSQS
jgi:hypothetical protein